MEDRKQRGLNQRLYLLEAEYAEACWKFVVRGSTGNRYSISITSNSVLCNCFDCKRRKASCKHIYFIVGRVAQDDELLEQMGSQLNYPILDRITPKLLERLGRTEKTERTEEGPRDSTCSICYEELVSEGESIDKCEVCKNGYHDTCIKMWLKTKNNCPMCRSPWNFSICLSKLSIS